MLIKTSSFLSLKVTLVFESSTLLLNSFWFWKDQHSLQPSQTRHFL